MPKNFVVKTGEEDEKILFNERAKLFRFDAEAEPPQFKERGVGQMKILEDSTTGKRRVVMRREQVHKLAANFYLSQGMKLTEMPKSEGKAYIWIANDFADEEPKMEKLAVRFKTAEQAKKFKAVFDDSVEKSTASGSPRQPPAKAAQHPAGKGTQPVAKQAEQPAAKTTQDPAAKGPQQVPATGSNSLVGLERFKPAPGSWTCKACYVRNGPELKDCQACGSDPEGNPPKTGGLLFGTGPGPFGATQGNSTGTGGFKFGLGSGTSATSAPTVAPVPLPSGFKFGFYPSGEQKQEGGEVEEYEDDEDYDDEEVKFYNKFGYKKKGK